MSGVTKIPMFPLSILPLPGELVPLHIFEPRYQQLLKDVETKDVSFGIYFSNEINSMRLGSLMRLESVIKRYPGGESDIIVKCEDIISIELLQKTYRDKLYPGGDVLYWNALDGVEEFPQHTLVDLYSEYMRLRNIHHQVVPSSLYHVANELNLDVNDRYKFLTTDEEHKQTFLINRVKFQIHLLRQEDKSRDVYHLN